MPFWRRNGVALAAAATILLIAVSGYWFVFRNLDHSNPVAESGMAGRVDAQVDTGMASIPSAQSPSAIDSPQPATASPAPSAAQIAQDEQEFGERFADAAISQPAARTAPAPLAKPISGLELDSAQVSPAYNANLLHPVRFSVPLRVGTYASGKRHLHIEIRDNLNRLVHTSPPLDSASYTLPKQLQPGLYFWHLVAKSGNQPSTLVYQGRFRLYRTLDRDGFNYNP
jgi:hypothetical protein